MPSSATGVGMPICLLGGVLLILTQKNSQKFGDVLGIIVSESIGRSPQAVANHWYTVVSKKPDSTCFFTASPKHVSRNRKNGEGVESTRNIWQRLMQVIRNL